MLQEMSTWQEEVDRIPQLIMQQLSIILPDNPWTGALSLLNPPPPIQETAHAAIIEGSVFKAENQVRITAQLIDGSTDEHLWSDDFERE